MKDCCVRFPVTVVLVRSWAQLKSARTITVIIVDCDAITVVPKVIRITDPPYYGEHSFVGLNELPFPHSDSRLNVVWETGRDQNSGSVWGQIRGETSEGLNVLFNSHIMPSFLRKWHDERPDFYKSIFGRCRPVITKMYYYDWYIVPNFNVSDRTIRQANIQRGPLSCCKLRFYLSQCVVSSVPLACRYTRQDDCEGRYHYGRGCRPKVQICQNGPYPTTDASEHRLEGYAVWLGAFSCIIDGWGLVCRNRPNGNGIQALIGLFLFIVAVWLVYHGFNWMEFATWSVPTTTFRSCVVSQILFSGSDNVD